MSPTAIKNKLSITQPSNLPELVLERFYAAKKSSSIVFLESEVKIVNINGIPFQVRYSSTLAKKPKGDEDEKKDDTPKINPFQNPPVELVVSGIGANHTLLLNKFSITPGHSILITNKELSQTYPLEEADIGATYAVIRQYRDSGEELFGFFNSGEHSGASQPHRHVQFMPVDQMKADLTAEAKKEWIPIPVHGDKLRDMQDKLPFVYFTAPLRGKETAEQLQKTYIALLEVARQTVDAYTSADPDAENIEADKNLPKSEEVPFSYNMAFMDKLMVILPRISSGSEIEGEDGEVIGYVELNGTALAGTLLVKERDVYERFEGEKGEKLLEKVLGGIGVPLDALKISLDWKRGLPQKKV